MTATVRRGVHPVSAPTKIKPDYASILVVKEVKPHGKQDERKQRKRK